MKMILNLINTYLVKGLVITTLLFCSTSVFYYTLYQKSSSELKLLQSKHNELQRDYEGLIKDYDVLKQSSEITSATIVNQRQELNKLEEGKKEVEDKLKSFKPKTCPKATANISGDNDETQYIDLDTPIDPEFRRLSGDYREEK